MMGWWYFVQGSGEYSREFAKIILDQNAGSMNWLSGRYREFMELILCEGRIVPYRSTNGIEHGHEIGDLLFVDSYFGSGEIYGCSHHLRVSMQMYSGNPVTPYIEISLYLDESEDIEDDDGNYVDNVTHGNAQISMVGSFGSPWQISSRFGPMNEYFIQAWADAFEMPWLLTMPADADAYERLCYTQERAPHGHISPKEVRVWLMRMTQYIRKQHESPSTPSTTA